jgi:hypothetical protein
MHLQRSQQISHRDECLHDDAYTPGSLIPARRACGILFFLRLFIFLHEIAVHFLSSLMTVSSLKARTFVWTEGFSYLPDAGLRAAKMVAVCLCFFLRSYRVLL